MSAASIEVGIFLTKRNSKDPNYFYHPLLKYLNAAILAAISVDPITKPYWDLVLNIYLKFCI